MNSIDLVKEIFSAVVNSRDDGSERMVSVKSLFEDKKDELLATLPPDTREAFEELFEIDISLKNEYCDYGIAIGIQTASIMCDVMRNPLDALNNLTKIYTPVEQAERLSIDRIDDYIKNHRATQ